MMKKMVLLSFTTVIALAPSAQATTQCSLGDITRSIDIVYSQPGQPVPCEVLYDKRAEGGTLTTLWRAQNEAGYCEARAGEFIARLEALGYTCSEAAADESVQKPAAGVN